MDEILNALQVYIKTKSDIPAPADLANIIKPPPVELSAAVYVSLQKKAYSGAYLLRPEREYCEKFRRQEMEKGKGGSDELRDANYELRQFKIELDKAATEYN